jgi:flavin reductase (DIM6/NTAB) family NADH-FMN oxidoreductase RutF
MIIDPSTLTTKDTYKLLIGSVVPRPIAWVSSINEEGTYNLAPFSFFTVASRQPPTLCISIGPGVGEREGTIKDTLMNIRTVKEFVINIVSFPLSNSMQKSSESFQPGVDEFREAGLTPVDSVLVRPPRVKESPINMECQLDQIIPVGQDHLVLGKMVRFHVRDELYSNGRIDLEALQPIGRLAGNYSLVENLFDLPHPDLESLRPKKE